MRVWCRGIASLRVVMGADGPGVVVLIGRASGASWAAVGGRCVVCLLRVRVESPW